MIRPRGPKYDTGTINDELPLVAHDWNAIVCSGFLRAYQEGEQYEIRCAECGFVVQKNLSDPDVRRVFLEMEATGEFCSVECANCGHQNVFTGIARVLVFACRECGTVVEVEEKVQ